MLRRVIYSLSGIGVSHRDPFPAQCPLPTPSAGTLLGHTLVLWGLTPDPLQRALPQLTASSTLVSVSPAARPAPAVSLRVDAHF